MRKCVDCGAEYERDGRRCQPCVYQRHKHKRAKGPGAGRMPRRFGKGHEQKMLEAERLVRDGECGPLSAAVRCGVSHVRLMQRLTGRTLEGESSPGIGGAMLTSNGVTASGVVGQSNIEWCAAKPYPEAGRGAGLMVEKVEVRDA